jgi:predicted 3-demethylubiquinone-9 3-methyltransferase (glyoxalase superfamily)
MSRITPFLWFDTNAEEAVTFYESIFANSRTLQIVRYPPGTPGPVDTVMTISFELDGQKFIALNGGPTFTFTPAVSFVINCDTQDEIDYYWEHLLQDGGTPSQCGWLTDKFGVSWQVVPTVLPEMLGHPDPDRAQRAAAAMLSLVKLDIDTLESACNNPGSRP